MTRDEALTRIKELENIVESFHENTRNFYDFWQGDENRITELEAHITELEANELRFPTLAEFSNLQDENERLIEDVKRLREGIEKHKETMSHLLCGFNIDKINLELYKLL